MLPRLKPNEARYNGNFGGPRTGLDNIFNVENITYDAVGNIQTLNRRGIIACDEEGNLADGYIDQLTYGYYPNSNRLQTVTDAATEEGLAEQGVKPHIGAYTYDAAGRMTGDPHRDMTITYNHLDLPATITVDGKKTFITYDATGRKWLQSSAESSVIYVGPFTYKLAGKDFELEAANLADGRIVHDTRHRELFTEYYHKDHLGNTRVAFTDRDDDGRVSIIGAGSEITQQNDFYPFGMAHAADGVFHGDVEKNRYRYNGKELQEDLGIYTAFYRSYDPAIGRWMQIDPKAESFASMSPYTGMGNNPILLTDPLGDSIRLEFIGQDPAHYQGTLTALINHNLEGQFEAKIGDDGILSIVATEGGGDVSALSDNGQRFHNRMEAITTAEGIADVKVDGFNGDVHVGHFESGTIDVMDMAMFNDNLSDLGGTTGGKIVHELFEQHYKQMNNADYAASHPSGLSAENYVNNSGREDIPYQPVATQDFVRGGVRVRTTIGTKTRDGIINVRNKKMK